MYQAGEVDYLVATDAIGMGLNLDIRHVAFSATHKFDGRRVRALFPHEMGQIAGRAGRHIQSGTFGVTGEAQMLDEGLIDALENHRFAPISRLMWRNAALEFGTMDRLVQSLEAAPAHELLCRGREADDLAALKMLREMAEIRDRVQGGKDVQLLWDVCRVPDFRGISPMEHATLLARIFGFLQDGGTIPSDWLDRAVRRIDRVGGDIDAISKRLAYIRTWTYVAQRSGWVADEKHWRAETRAVEDRLSDALHAALTQRFVDRRTSVLLRRLNQKESLVAEVNDKGEVTVEGEFAGRLEGFRFRPDQTGSADEARMLNRASYEALRPEFHLRADRFYNAPDTEMDFTEQGGLMWGNQAVGKLVKGHDALHPGIEIFVDEEAGTEIADKVRRRLQHFMDRKVAALFEPLLTMSHDETLTGLARGFAFRLVEHLGILPREGVASEVKQLDQEARAALRKHGVRFGQFTIFLPALLKPAPTRLRLVLWSLAEGLDEFPESPPPGLVTIPNLPEVPSGYYTLSGYHPAGDRAIRIDMLERLADMLRTQDTRGGFEANPDMLSITGMTLEQFAGLMQGLGYSAEKAERPKTKPALGAVQPLPETAPSDAPMTEEESVLAAETRARWEAEQAARRAAQAEMAQQDQADPAADHQDEAGADPEEVEIFYTFRWSPKPRGPRRPKGEGRRGQSAQDGAEARQQGRPKRHGSEDGRKSGSGRREGKADSKPGGKAFGKPGGKSGGKTQSGSAPRNYSSRPEKKIDPDSPFAILAQLKGRKEVQPAPSSGQRLDLWLYLARVFKTRAVAADRIARGGIRVNSRPCSKPGTLVRVGDELVVSAFGRLRVMRVLDLPARRGPACEAATLYLDLSDPLIDPGEGNR
ncbi:MAG: S4 domain-containing protein, partial [Paracoccus sp. (in: a-proteobacteria)]|nr:S4 domain-containing protein [Paracoccus sp. (in: a-proteobacteria)]